MIVSPTSTSSFFFELSSHGVWGENGQEADAWLWEADTHGFNTQPKWFPFELKARDEKRRKIVEEAYIEARRTDPLGHG